MSLHPTFTRFISCAKKFRFSSFSLSSVRLSTRQTVGRAGNDTSIFSSLDRMPSLRSFLVLPATLPGRSSIPIANSISSQSYSPLVRATFSPSSFDVLNQQGSFSKRTSQHRHQFCSAPFQQKPVRSSIATRALFSLSREANNYAALQIRKIHSDRSTILHNLWQILLAGLAALFMAATTSSGLVCWSLALDAEPTSTAAATVTPGPVRHSTSKHPIAVANSNKTAAKHPSVSFLPRRGASAAPSANTEAYANVAEMNKRIIAEWEGKPYDVSVRAIRGSRFTMEDEYYVGNGGRLAAVFDGHGGSGVSQYLKSNLHPIWTECLKEKHWEERDDDQVLHQHRFFSSSSASSSQQQELQRPSVSCHVAALRATFEQLESNVIKNDDFEYQGSTAVAIVVHEGEDGSRTLLSANIGDSRAVLSRNKRAVDLTRDHKPNDEKEKARIMGMGETIEWDQDCKVHRVRNLSLARAIGDRYAKPAVSSEVEIQHFPVIENEDSFVILASDGLWDVMSSQAAVTFMHEYMDSELSKMSKENAKNYKYVLRRNMAKFLAREAMRKGSTDNISVLVVWL